MMAYRPPAYGALLLCSFAFKLAAVLYAIVCTFALVNLIDDAGLAYPKSEGITRLMEISKERDLTFEDYDALSPEEREEIKGRSQRATNVVWIGFLGVFGLIGTIALFAVGELLGAFRDLVRNSFHQTNLLVRTAAAA